VPSLRVTELAEVEAPAVLWRPSTEVRPLVLLGHGGSGHKTNTRITALAAELVELHGLACLAIDGPFHGDRAPSGSSATDYQRLMVEAGIDNIIDALTQDWINAIDAVANLVDTSRIAYIGVSIGTRFGLPLLARLGKPTVRAAVLGKFGLLQEGLHPSLQTNARTLADANAVQVPIHFHAQINDEIFPLNGQQALFSAIGSPEKTWSPHPGGHVETPRSAPSEWCSFVAAHLKGQAPEKCRHPRSRPTVLGPAFGSRWRT